MSTDGGTATEPIAAIRTNTAINGSSEATPLRGPGDWEFAGWGSVKNVDMTEERYDTFAWHNSQTLGQYLATSIAGNDITSSVLFVAGLVAVPAGKLAPISLILVVITLYLFKNVYAEVGSALPLNGGAYNVLLNTTSKFLASVAAMLTLLSYVATAVVSAREAMGYANVLWDKWDPFWSTIGLLFLFAVLNILGISESAVVAAIIFTIHLVTLAILVVLCIIYVARRPDVFYYNFDRAPLIRNVPTDIFFGFCAGLLGVSGFESSANYIEEQKPGVFPKTLRNMIICVAVFNPLISLLSLGVLTLDSIRHEPITTRLLAEMAGVVGADLCDKCPPAWLKYIVAVDAVMVLSGAVLTSYVGVTGLVRRMTLDRILPQFLLQINKWRQTNHWIIIAFFLVTSSLFLIVQGKVSILSGVYTISFLSVMALFAIGNMLLKYKRGRIPRTHRALWPTVIASLIAVSAALIGNIIYGQIAGLDYVKYFSIYFSATFIIVVAMLQRTFILKVLAYFLTYLPFCPGILAFVQRQVKFVRDQPIVFFTKTDEIDVLNKAVLYVRQNELTDKIIIVHVYDEEDSIPPKLQEGVEVLDKMYPKITIDLLLARGDFGPFYVQQLAKHLHVPINFCFITCPSDSFPHDIGDFGGVRLITH